MLFYVFNKSGREGRKMNKTIRMKNAILSLVMIVLFLGFIPVKSFARNWNGWIYQDLYPTSNTLLGVKFVTPKKGWVVGENGAILYTEDGGASWQAQESGTEETLTNIAFVNEKVGWAVGAQGRILHTEDGGKTWISQVETEAVLKNIFFINGKEGWAIGSEEADAEPGSKGVVFHTTNSGEKWEQMDIGISRAMASIYFINQQTGWILAGDEVYRTSDGGKKWEKNKLQIESMLTSPTNRMRQDIPPNWDRGELCFTDAKYGWAVLGFGYIFHTNDGGRTWINQLHIDSHSYGLSHISFSDSNRGCAGGSSLLCTEDGGKTWSEKLGIKPGSSERIDNFLVQLQAVSFPNPTSAWAVGNEGQIWKTENGGKSWNLAFRRDECGRHVFFLDKNTGWFYHREDYSASLCRTDDGGRTRQKQDVGMNVWGLFFTDASMGWAVGTMEEWNQQHKLEKVYGVIRHTADGGKTWLTQYKELMGKSRVGTGLLGVFFVNPDTGWVVGKQGMILHTADGGKLWVQQKSGASQLGLNDIRFVSQKIGWIAGIKYDDGWTGIILHTEDGGNHWQTQYSIKDVGFTAGYFTDKKNGWVTGLSEDGGDGWLLHTNDGGSKWRKEEFGDIGYSDVAFLDKERGVISTEKGWIFISSDDGKTWKKIKKPIRKKNPWHFSELFD